MGGDNHLEIKDICRLLQRKRWTVYRYIRELDFPKPVNPHTRPKRWRIDDVRLWAEREGFTVNG